ncbi:MAG: hypothetical protein HKN23_14300, partial [Verrucomicrobiales bacterium]|nr:hypothetical protein [Verrucomicrobiales bacterium]
MKSLFLASLALAIFGLLAAWLLRRFKIQSPTLHRLAWGVVLIQGIIFAGIPFQLPLLEPAPIAEILESPLPPLPENFSAAPVNPLVAPIPEATAAAETTRSFSITENGLWFAYFAGLIAVVALALAAYVALIFAVRKARPAPETWADQWSDLLEKNGQDHDSIPLLVHDRLGPMLCRLPGGYRVVVPSTPWENLTDAQREAVLIHEIAHVERRDVWKTLGARFVATLHWFNPFAWWSARQFEEAAEWDCDQRLATRGKRHAIEYAKALLQFAEPKSRLPIGASLARGAALSPRIRRLTSENGNTETWIRRLGFAAFLAIASTVALFRFELIAQQPASAPGEEFKKDLAEFSEEIDATGDTVTAFRDSLKTPAGQIVMKDLASGVEQENLKSKAATALPDHIERYFEKNGDGKLEVKSDAEDFRERFKKLYAGYSEDIEILKPAMAETRELLAEDTEAGKLLGRFLDQKGAANWLYVKAIRDFVRPGMKVIEDRLGVVLTRGGDGKLFVPKSRVPDAEKVARMGDGVVALMEAIEVELPLFAAEVAETDEFHKRVKKTMNEPMFAGFVASD